MNTRNSSITKPKFSSPLLMLRMAAAALSLAVLTSHLSANRLCAADNHALKARFQFRSGGEVFDLPNVFVWMADPSEVEQANRLSREFNPVDNRVNHLTITELRTKPSALVADASRPINLNYVGKRSIQLKTGTLINEPASRFFSSSRPTNTIEMPRLERCPSRFEFFDPYNRPSAKPFYSFVFPVTHRFAGVSNDKGELTIEGVPAGTFGFRIWLGSEVGYPKSLSINGKQFTPRRGVQRVVIGTQGADLGNVIVVPND